MLGFIEEFEAVTTGCLSWKLRAVPARPGDRSVDTLIRRNSTTYQHRRWLVDLGVSGRIASTGDVLYGAPKVR